ncbi:MAG TPA: carbon-nitrogen hydrolase family protein [Miltoncostaeaceae bacterium]|nr:carbon-nitrogen hydrolase family protein [Miltoncostaeaceae bacterium]
MSEPGVLRVGAVQMTSGDDVGRNLGIAERLVAEAAAAGARLVVLPEKWNVIDRDERQVAVAEPLDGPSLAAASGWARELGVALVAGSISELVLGDGRAYNTSALILPDGTVAGVYRKLHLFDVEVGGRVYRESASARGGDGMVVVTALGHRIGLSVCYDLRFPELYRALALAGAEVLCVPSAFTAATGKDHWEPLLRARAIENQAFVIAAGQVGVHATGAASHGRSMIVDPWGVVLAQAPDTETAIVADLDFERLRHVRERLPALEHRRPDVYGDPLPARSA